MSFSHFFSSAYETVASAASTAATTVTRTASMLATQVYEHAGRAPYSYISPGLYIGRIPIKEAHPLTLWSSKFDNSEVTIQKFITANNTDQKLGDRPLRFIVSVVEPDEAKGKGFGSIKEMVSPKHWKALDAKIETHALSIKDKTAKVDDEKIIETVELMRKHISAGESMFIHCYAGKGRSVMTACAYLMVNGVDPQVEKPMDFKDVYTLLKNQRPHIDFDEVQQAKAQAVAAEMLKRKKVKVVVAVADEKASASAVAPPPSPR